MQINTSAVLKRSSLGLNFEAVVYTPNVLDSQGEYIGEEELKKAAYAFLRDQKTRNIDTEHDGVPNGAVVVASRITTEAEKNFAPGSWVVGLEATEEIANSIRNGTFNYLSMGGSGTKVPKRNGNDTVNELKNVEIDFISLVKSGANKYQGKDNGMKTKIQVAKTSSSPSAVIAELAKVVEKAVADCNAMMRRSDAGSTAPSQRQIAMIEKAQDDKQIRNLQRKLAAKTDRLEALWAGAYHPNRDATEHQLQESIYETEVELESLRGSNAVDFTSSKHSVFERNGGRSYVSVAQVGNASDSLGVQKSGGDERIDLSDDLDAISFGIRRT